MAVIGRFVYLFAIRIYGLAIHIAASFNRKAQLWVEGRKPAQYSSPSPEKKIWFHVASLGEYEQARPVIDELRVIFPHKKIVITFFSPSGYTVVKQKNTADEILYLPLDTPANARFICNYINPELVVFVKYEFWYFTITELKKRNVPVLLIAALFRPGQVFFRWYGGLFRNLLRCFDYFFVQDTSSVGLLASIGFFNAKASGDTRFDRVMQIASENVEFPLLNAFKNNSLIFIAGSTWQQDHHILIAFINDISRLFPDIKFILAPHEIDTAHIKQMQREIISASCCYSSLTIENAHRYKVLIIDNIGMLSRLYRFGEIAYVGGGFGRGIHSILEPAVYGIPVIFGPRHQHFKEAQEMLDMKVAFCIENEAALQDIFQKLICNDALRQQCRQKLNSYFRKNAGATRSIVEYIGQKLN